ncbi:MULTISPECIES: asparaginase [Mesorhizobium]|uniref:Asparaginase n=1 Tax=Mesorhizobium denitrificans TaxID=2294114 RepID=A0A371XHU7_9HYPH|nr:MULTISPECIES: asparaginase [Mesorhizobium]RFC68792.1 asparaginase [Mesorhizobium denitrificans]
MSDPVLLEVTRGDFVESRHRGAIAIYDFDGKPVVEIGDVDRLLFPRSAVKSMQALPLIETGAADALGFQDADLAMACASHVGEPAHVERAAAMLAKLGLDESALECGTHWPSDHASEIALARAGGAPNQLHNNCSGKHSGFLGVCVHCGMDHHGYVGFGHPFQQMIRETMQDVTGIAHDSENAAVDGCAIPTYAVPLRSLALGFSRMGGGKGLSADRAAAAKRLMNAAMHNPFYVSGTDKADTLMMQAAPGRIFVKGGAEGVFCGVIPERGLAIAVKCNDGAGRGADAIGANIVAQLFADEPDVATRIEPVALPPIRNRNGAIVGGIRPADILAELQI